MAVSGGLFNAKQFRSPAYMAYTIFGFLCFLGLFTGKSAPCALSFREVATPG